MKITLEQLEVLDRLECQRLSSDSQNMYEVENFSNDVNDDIAQTLRNEALQLKILTNYASKNWTYWRN